MIHFMNWRDNSGSVLGKCDWVDVSAIHPIWKKGEIAWRKKRKSYSEVSLSFHYVIDCITNQIICWPSPRIPIRFGHATVLANEVRMNMTEASRAGLSVPMISFSLCHEICCVPARGCSVDLGPRVEIGSRVWSGVVDKWNEWKKETFAVVDHWGVGDVCYHSNEQNPAHPDYPSCLCSHMRFSHRPCFKGLAILSSLFWKLLESLFISLCLEKVMSLPKRTKL